MVAKIISTVVIVAVVYVLLVFLSPATADRIGGTIGTTALNTQIRGWKDSLDGFTRKSSGVSSGATLSGEIDSVNSTLQSVKDRADAAKQVLNQKAQQVNDVVDTAKQVGSDLQATRNHVQELQVKMQKVETFSGQSR